MFAINKRLSSFFSHLMATKIGYFLRQENEQHLSDAQNVYFEDFLKVLTI